jgi:hypothetical protein
MKTKVEIAFGPPGVKVSVTENRKMVSNEIMIKPSLQHFQFCCFGRSLEILFFSIFGI